MKNQVPYGSRYWYDHMKPADVAIWEEFMQQNPEAYDTVIYDQEIGEGAEIPEGTQPNIAKSFKILTQYKIDVIGFKNEKVDIIELKPRAGLAALGQVLGYVALFKKEFPPILKISAVIITDKLRPDMLALAASMRVKIYTTETI